MEEGGGHVRVRRMTEADIKSVKEIDRELAGPGRLASWPLRIESHWWVYQGLSNYVAEVDGEVIGFLLGDIRGAAFGTEASGWIDIIGVLPRYQGKGIGRSLVEAFSDECRREGMKVRVILASDRRLAQFWKSMGFSRGRLVCFEK
ncbi:MAG: GNAT family N-acetyltransferase [Dehalococcoidia bacterium]|nr:GNAT family N-acetyltransferase [Dehalococcoidia bacterium]